MNRVLFAASLFGILLAAGCRKPEQNRAGPPEPAIKRPPTYSSLDLSSGTNAPIPIGSINFNDADLKMVLAVYEDLSGRTLIHSPQVPLNTKITFRNTTPLTRIEALQAFDDVFAANGIAMIYLGTRYVKAVPAAAVNTEPTPIVELPWQQLPQSSSPVTYIVRLKHLPSDRATSVLQPFARLPNSIIAARGSDVLILRDYSANVRRMMEILEQVDTPGRPDSTR